MSMDIQKAIEWQEKFKQSYQNMPLTKPKVDEACDFTIVALRELQLYRLIGTVDECREAMDRQVAKEPQFHISEFQCPNCGMENLEEIDDLGHIYLRHKYCPDCGQALKWGD